MESDELAILTRIDQRLEQLAILPNEDRTVYISATTPYTLDYRGRKHVYLYSATGLSLSLEDLGTLAVAANSWTEISFLEGMRIFATNQASVVPVFIRASDTLMYAAGGSGGASGNVNLTEVGGAAFGLGDSTQANSLSVTLASNDPALTDLSNLPSISTNTAHLPTALGQNTMANSLPVVLPSNQSNVPVAVQSTPANQSVNLTEVAGSAVALGQATMAASFPVAIASNQGNVPVSVQNFPADQAVNIAQVAGTPIATGNAALPVLDSTAPGYVAAFASNPATTGTANTDAAFKWGASGTTQVNHIMIQNNSSSVVLFDLDVATTGASPTIAAGQTFFFDVQVTALHLQSATANVPINAASGIVIRGWL